MTIAMNYVLLWAVLVAHEAGHLAAAAALRLPVIAVELGEGDWKSFSWRGVRVKVGLMPFTGCVRTAWPSRRRWKNAAVILAGPLVNLAAGPLVYWAEPNSILHEFAAMSIVVGVLNLAPSWSYDTDGAQLWAELRRGRDGVLTR